MGCGQVQNKKPIKTEEKPTVVQNAPTSAVVPNGIKVSLLPPFDRVKEMFFPTEQKLENVLMDILAKLPETRASRVLIYGDKYLFNEDGQKQLKDLLPADVKEVKIEVRYLGVDISKDAIEDYGKIKYLAKPIRDGDLFEIIIYNKTNQTISIDSLTTEIDTIENNSLLHFNELTGYCSGVDKLYISGGEIERKGNEGISKDTSSNFWTINLENKSIVKHPKGLIHPRKWHSMIYVPKNFVFMVGGTVNKKVEYYDIEKNEFIDHSELSEARCEPSLALVDNAFLYAFSGFKLNKSLFKNFERINLLKNNKVWEVMEFKLPEGLSVMSQALFGISYRNSKELIFLGGVDLDNEENPVSERNFIFHADLPVKVSDVPKVEEEFSEKCFLPILPNISFALPNMYKDTLKISHYNETGKYGVINFEPDTVRVEKNAEPIIEKRVEMLA